MTRRLPRHPIVGRLLPDVFCSRRGGRRPLNWDRRGRRPPARDPPSFRGRRTRRRSAPPRTACACTRWGLPCPTCHQVGGALLPHPFTLTRRGGRFAFCGTFPDPQPGGRWPLATTVSCRVRTFLDAGGPASRSSVRHHSISAPSRGRCCADSGSVAGFSQGVTSACHAAASPRWESRDHRQGVRRNRRASRTGARTTRHSTAGRPAGS